MNIYDVTESFRKTNQSINWEASAGPKIMEYIELRLSNNLRLLENQALAEALGVNYEELLEETRKLMEYSRTVVVPDCTKTPTQPDKKGFWR